MDTVGAIDVANELIRVAHENGKSISNMKLQKLLYLAQGIHLALENGAPLFEDTIEAWKYGPVVLLSITNSRYILQGRFLQTIHFQLKMSFLILTRSNWLQA